MKAVPIQSVKLHTRGGLVAVAMSCTDAAASERLLLTFKHEKNANLLRNAGCVAGTREREFIHIMNAGTQTQTHVGEGFHTQIHTRMHAHARRHAHKKTRTFGRKRAQSHAHTRTDGRLLDDICRRTHSRSAGRHRRPALAAAAGSAQLHVHAGALLAWGPAGAGQAGGSGKDGATEMRG
eukprot:10429-Chlamydomonas_euryale.AAC.1